MGTRSDEEMALNTDDRHGVRRGEMIWVGGQASLYDQDDIKMLQNLRSQVNEAMERFSTILNELESDLHDLVFLLCFYVEDGTGSEGAFLNLLAANLPDGVKTAITVVPVPSLMHSDQLVEIEGYAMRRENGDRMSRTHSVSPKGLLKSDRFCSGIRCGKMIFVSGQSPIDQDACIYAPCDIVAQTVFEMEEIGNILEKRMREFLASKTIDEVANSLERKRPHELKVAADEWLNSRSSSKRLRTK